VSISSVDVEQLTKRIGDLDLQSEHLRILLYVWTFVVVVGLIVEYRTQLIALVGLLWQYAKKRSPLNWAILGTTLLGIAGGALVTVGVTGELWIEFSESRTETELAVDNGKLTGGLGQLVTDAKRNADAASVTADKANRKAMAASSEADAAKTESGIAKTNSGEAKNAAASALSLAGSVQTKVDEASAQLTQVNTKAKELGTEVSKTKTELTGLAVCNAPRVITDGIAVDQTGRKTYVDALLPMAGQKVFIEYVPFDGEARRAALSIANALNAV
jgi:hypothetical protein